MSSICCSATSIVQIFSIDSTKRIRKYNGFVTGLTQNVEELLKSDTARLMLANSEFLILLNQATTDREELASLLNISDNQLSYITNVGGRSWAYPLFWEYCPHLKTASRRTQNCIG